MSSPVTLFRPTGELRPLRGRQLGLIPQIAEAVRQGHRYIGVQAPTGAGKTVIATHLMESSARKGKRPMFVAPAIALVEQTLISFEDQGLSDIGIIQAKHSRTDWKAQIQIASRDTLIRRALPEVDLVIVDEFHDRREALDDILRQWKDKVVIGLSATPWTKGLGLLWTKLIVMATMADMIADGPPNGLCSFRIFSAPHDPNTSGLRTVAGDFEEGGAARVMSEPRIIGDAVETWLKHRQLGNHPGDRTFLYGVNRAHARSLMEAFNAQGVSCGYVDGDSSPDERLRSFRRYRSGEDKIIANVGVLVTGVDEDVRCIQDCALSKSEIKHVQRWGRGARLAEGKDYCLGLDHAANCTRLGLPWDIHHDTLDTRTPKDKGDAYEDDAPTPKPRKCQKCFAIIPPSTRACPACGDVYVKPNTIEHEQGELVEFVGKQLKLPKTRVSEEQAFYSGFLQMAERRGFKEGWAAMKFKEKFGVFPSGLEKRPMTPRKAVKEFERESAKRYRESKKAQPVPEPETYHGAF